MKSLDKALEHCVSAIVSIPGDVSVYMKQTLRNGTSLQIRVNPADIGKVIGRDGKTINALRTLMSALNEGNNVRVDVIDRYGR